MEIADCIWDADTTFLCCPGMIDDMDILREKNCAPTALASSFCGCVSGWIRSFLCSPIQCNEFFQPMLWIRIRIRRIRMCLGLLVPDPSLFCADPNPSIDKEKEEEKTGFLLFVISYWLFIFEGWCKCTSESYKKNFQKRLIFIGCLSATDDKSRIQMIRKSVERICGIRIRTVPKWHGSTTLLPTMIGYMEVSKFGSVSCMYGIFWFSHPRICIWTITIWMRNTELGY